MILTRLLKDTELTIDHNARARKSLKMALTTNYNSYARTRGDRDMTKTPRSTDTHRYSRTGGSFQTHEDVNSQTRAKWAEV